MPKLEMMQIKIVIRERMIEEFTYFFFLASFSAVTLTSARLLARFRSSMFAACALALVSSDYTTRGRLWAAR